MPFYMFYRAKAKPDSLEQLSEIRTEFEGIYLSHEINIVGVWENADDPTEFFYMSWYENETEYKAKVEELRSDARYVELNEALAEIRVESQAIRMTPTYLPE